MASRKDIINLAKNEVGTMEKPANSNNVKYNTWYYGKSVSGDSYPWCAVFISWLFRNTNLVKKTASCMDMAQWFKDNGRWSKAPSVGDIVFFKFGTNNRWTNHVGLVIGVNNNSILTIEGNTSTSSDDNGGKVMQRSRNLKNVVGYGTPLYEDVKDISEVVKEVIEGKWGTGSERKRKLTQAGYDYATVQQYVNKILLDK